MKKFMLGSFGLALTAVFLVGIMFLVSNVATVALAEEYDYHEFDKDWVITTMVVADKGWDYDIIVNARVAPDINAPIAKVLCGGTLLSVVDFYYTDDGRIWAECWYYGEYVYVSCMYLQPEDEGSFFYLPMEVEVLEFPCDDSRSIAEFRGDQLVLVSEIVGSNNYGYWAKVPADGRYGYIQLVLLDPIW